MLILPKKWHILDARILPRYILSVWNFIVYYECMYGKSWILSMSFWVWSLNYSPVYKGTFLIGCKNVGNCRRRLVIEAKMKPTVHSCFRAFLFDSGRTCNDASLCGDDNNSCIIQVYWTIQSTRSHGNRKNGWQVGPSCHPNVKESPLASRESGWAFDWRGFLVSVSGRVSLSVLFLLN